MLAALLIPVHLPQILGGERASNMHTSLQNLMIVYSSAAPLVDYSLNLDPSRGSQKKYEIQPPSRGIRKSAIPEPSPYNKTSDVFSPEYKANTSRRIDFS